ncbi:putative mitochondrial protein [Tanacetum coccineum]
MAPQTRSLISSNDEDRESLRQSITILMREKMEKLIAEMCGSAIDATVGGNGMIARPQAKGQRVDGVADDQKVNLVLIHLHDIALTWHKQFVRLMRDNVPWGAYRQAILQRFVLAYNDPLVEIKKVKHVKTILQSDVEVAVRMFKPRSLVELYGLAKLQETNLNPMKSKNRMPLLHSSRFSGKQLTQKELEEKRAKNLCFYYDQKYMPGHKMAQVRCFFRIVVDNDEETSLGTKPMRNVDYDLSDVFYVVQGENKYSGFTHNFLSSNHAKRIRISIGEYLILCKVTVAIEDYNDVFDLPKALPPIRSHDHRIPLKEGTPTINIRPYRHPATKKDAIESMVQELLDGSLNKRKIKDKFPIPLIEELIDDLRSSYHQIRMYPDDIAKTTFQTHQGHYEFLVMPFGLTNAPSTFQFLMNQVFKPFLRKFTLMFFDDILVYSPDMKSHTTHLKMVLQTMRQHQLKAKLSKYVFGASQVEHLGHVISDKGVATDPTKIQAMKEWHAPKNLKQLRGFLDLTRYYRRFIKNYAMISYPLTKLLRKNAFVWNKEAEQVFVQLKEAMMAAPVLKLPNFEEDFVVETDASGAGIGAVLKQQGHQVAYLSKALSPKHQLLSTYEKEFLTVLQALDKWIGYLLDRHFKIKTDHLSLKYLLDQRISTPTLIKWLPKLMGFYYEIEYKRGKYNVAADALSRIQGNDISLQHDLVEYFHAGSTGRHSGVKVTTHSMCVLLYWKKMRKHIKQLVNECSVCHLNKVDLGAYPGFLKPLPIPQSVWSEVFMDFIDGLPASKVAQAFLDNIYKLQGLPKAIVSDRDKVFLKYWYNTNYHTSINTTPFEVLYDQPPLPHIAYVQGDINVDVVDRSMTAREEAITLHKFHLGRCLKLKLKGDCPNSQQALLEVNKDALISDKPQAVLERKTIKKGPEETDFHGILEDKNYSKRKALIELNLESQQ